MGCGVCGVGSEVWHAKVLGVRCGVACGHTAETSHRAPEHRSEGAGCETARRIVYQIRCIYGQHETFAMAAMKDFLSLENKMLDMTNQLKQVGH